MEDHIDNIDLNGSWEIIERALAPSEAGAAPDSAALESGTVVAVPIGGAECAPVVAGDAVRVSCLNGAGRRS